MQDAKTSVNDIFAQTWQSPEKSMRGFLLRILDTLSTVGLVL